MWICDIIYLNLHFIFSKYEKATIHLSGVKTSKTLDMLPLTKYTERLENCTSLSLGK